MINRWRLEKANPKAKLSPPKKQIVWYIEDNVPEEYRPYVQEGILEWNKAFEKIGYKDAIAVRWQHERDDFEPEDINYCTLRWITTGSTFAMSGLRSEPAHRRDDRRRRDLRRELDQDLARGVCVPDGRAHPRPGPWRPRHPAPHRSRSPWREIISPIMAMKQGFGLAVASSRHRPRRGAATPQSCGTHPRQRDGRPWPLDVVPSGWDPIQAHLCQRIEPGPAQPRATTRPPSPSEMRFATLALAMADQTPADKDKDKEKDKDKNKDKRKQKRKRNRLKLPEEFLGQAIKEVVMHEVGHSLGLRHNFKASIMLRPDQINDTSITRVKGMTGSVMDYNPINIAPKGQKQGDYASTTIGPYDYWAIEYAYTAGRRQRGRRAQEDRRSFAGPRPRLRDR